MTRRMFEMTSGTSSKFWEVWQEGTTVCTRYGRIGTTGQNTTKDPGTIEKAQKLHDKLVAEKLAKGYAEKGAAPVAKKAAPATRVRSAAHPAAVVKPHAEAHHPPFDAEKTAARLATIEAAAAKAGVVLPPGASEADIAAAEARLGVTFPPDMRAFYRAHDGGPDDVVCGGRQLLSLADIVSQWGVWKELFDDGTFDDDGVEADTGVRARWWLPAWIPVSQDLSGNHDMVDLAPDKRGVYGQVLSFWHDDPSRTIEGDDFLSWLEDQEWGDSDGEKDEAPHALSAPSAWKPGPYVFVFRLGKNARAEKTRVPPAFTTVPCYYYRQDRGSFGERLGRIPEPDVAGEDVKVTFAAIDGFVAANALRPELYSDAEIAAGGAYSETRGFHTGATYDQAKEALAEGGFNVIDCMAPAGFGPDVDELARHLHLTSVALVHASLRDEVSGLLHAQGASRELTTALQKGRGDALFAALQRAAPTWTAEMRDALGLLAAEASLRHARFACGGLDTDAGRATLGSLRALLAGLPPTADAESRRRLQAWGLLDGAPSPVWPEELPRSVEAALALVDGTGLAGRREKPNKTARGAPLPNALVEVYRHLSTLGRRTILPPTKHGDLREELVSAIRAAEDADPVAEGDVDAASLSAPEGLVPFGKDSGGDVFFLDPAWRVADTTPVLRFVHDEGRTCRVEASSLATFIAGRGLEEAYGLGLHGAAVDALVERDRARVPLPPPPAPRATPARKKSPARKRD